MRLARSRRVQVACRGAHRALPRREEQVRAENARGQTAPRKNAHPIGQAAGVHQAKPQTAGFQTGRHAETALQAADFQIGRHAEIAPQAADFLSGQQAEERQEERQAGERQVERRAEDPPVRTIPAAKRRRRRSRRARAATHLPQKDVGVPQKVRRGCPDASAGIIEACANVASIPYSKALLR